jgi:hypothetical protein
MPTWTQPVQGPDRQGPDTPGALGLTPSPFPSPPAWGRERGEGAQWQKIKWVRITSQWEV